MTGSRAGWVSSRENIQNERRKGWKIKPGRNLMFKKRVTGHQELLAREAGRGQEGKWAIVWMLHR